MPAPSLRKHKHEIVCEVCKLEGYLQQLVYYCKVRHYLYKAKVGKSKVYYHQQTQSFIKALIASNESSIAGKTLIKVGSNPFAEAGQAGVQVNNEHQARLESGLETQCFVRDSPSLVWGRPAKSVVERPRGFNSHIPRHP
jgi:hypothetical protein